MTHECIQTFVETFVNVLCEILKVHRRYNETRLDSIVITIYSGKIGGRFFFYKRTISKFNPIISKIAINSKIKKNDVFNHLEMLNSTNFQIHVDYS